MRTSSIISAAIAIFSVFAAASPVASVPALVVRDDSAGDGIITALQSCSTKLDACHAKYKAKCASSCSQTDIINWQKESAAIIVDITAEIKIAIPSGFKFTDPSACVGLIAAIIVNINIALTFLLGQCGLLGGLLSLVLVLVLSLLGELKIAINGLLVVLALVVDGLLSLVASLLVTLLGGATCYCCSLFGF